MKYRVLKWKGVTLAAVATLGLVFAACSGSAEREGGAATRDLNDPVALANRALSVLSYSPNGQGWAYKATGVSGDFTTWASNNKDKIQQALDQVGDGYVLQVTGHTCNIGPRTPPGDGRRGNMFYSEQRARSVYNALVTAGVPANRMTVKGVADTEPLPGAPRDGQAQRRVTFQIVARPAQ